MHTGLLPDEYVKDHDTLVAAPGEAGLAVITGAAGPVRLNDEKAGELAVPAASKPTSLSVYDPVGLPTRSAV